MFGIWLHCGRLELQVHRVLAIQTGDTVTDELILIHFLLILADAALHALFQAVQRQVDQ